MRETHYTPRPLYISHKFLDLYKSDLTLTQELETCFARQLLQHCVESKRYLLQCLEVVEHLWISQCNGSLIPNISPLDLIPFKTIYTTGSKMQHRYAVHNITVVHSSTIQHPHSCMYVVVVASSITPSVK